MQNNSISKNYLVILSELKNKVRQAQIRAHLAVNAELIKLYWEIGKTIFEQQKAQGWGSKVITQLSKDLINEFPNMKGFSYRNMKYMKQFYEGYHGVIIGQQLVAQLPWGHNVILLQKTNSYEERLWYAQKTIENNWSRSVLVIQIETNLYQRQHVTEKITNFKQTLPQAQSDLAEQLIKDPYNFDFLTMRDSAHERDIESQLVKHIRKFLLELGAGFAFVGEQYPLEVDKKDYYIDLLFYHTKLHCYVVLELKNTDFKPEYIGKLNFYLSAVDDILKGNNDNKTIGLLLCTSKGKITAEYALRDISKPMGISEFKYLENLPESVKSNLPTIEEIEAEFS